MNGQGMQLKPSYNEVCEGTPKIQKMSEELNDILRLSSDISGVISQIKIKLYGLYPEPVNQKNNELVSVNEYIEASKYVLIDALEELYQLRERL